MIGLSTYAYFWRLSEKNPNRMSLADALRHTHSLGVELFQICDHAPLDSMSDDELRDVRNLADDLGLTLELGTKGLEIERPQNYLRIAGILDVRLVRSMVNSPTHQPTMDEAAALLREAVPAYERAGVTLALETYEQVGSAELVQLVETVSSPNLGICLDPANTVARLEHPSDVITRTAPHVKNLHIKDFTFSRKDGWVGFSLVGCPMGEGMLPYDEMIAAVRPAERGINQVIEHWLPLLDGPNSTTLATTLQAEEAWTAHNLTYLRSK